MNAASGEGILDLKDTNQRLLNSVEGPWYRTYSKTASLLLLIHLIYFYQVLRRKSRRKLLVSYARLIRKKQFHKALPALLSHAPTKNASSQNYSAVRNTTLRSILEWYSSSIFFNGKRLSGLPLLFYNSFILWNCRALEPLIGEAYWRLLWGLTVVALMLDLCVTHFILTLVRDMHYGRSSPFFAGVNFAGRIEQGPSNRGVERVEEVLSHRTIGSLTLVSSAVLAVFQDRFPFVPLPTLPFFGRILPFLSIPSLSYLLCLGSLFLLSRTIHPVSSIFCGTLSGMLWSSNVTSFLIEPYWSNGTIFIHGLLCALSLKASGSSNVPCIDYVAWDNHGHIIEEEIFSQTLSNESSSDNEDSSSDDLESQEHSLEGLPMFSQDRDEIIRNRLPLVGLNDVDDVGGNEHYPLLSQTVPTNSRMRSRRILRQ